MRNAIVNFIRYWELDISIVDLELLEIVAELKFVVENINNLSVIM